MLISDNFLIKSAALNKCLFGVSTVIKPSIEASNREISFCTHTFLLYSHKYENSYFFYLCNLKFLLYNLKTFLTYSLIYKYFFL